MRGGIPKKIIAIRLKWNIFAPEDFWAGYATVFQDKYNAMMARAVAGGGQKGLDRHVKRNKKMFVRDRVKLLLDEGEEYLELSPFAGLGADRFMIRPNF